MIATPATVPDDIWFKHIQKWQTGFFGYFGNRFVDIRCPEAVAPPGVETAVIAGFENGIEYITIFDDMSAESSFVDVDTSPWHIINGAMVNPDFMRHGDMYRGSLFFIATGHGDQAILHEAIFGIIVTFGSWRAVDVLEILFAISEYRASYGGRIADKRNSVGPAVVNVTSPNGDSTVIIVYKNGVIGVEVKTRKSNTELAFTVLKSEQVGRLRLVLKAYCFSRALNYNKSQLDLIIIKIKNPTTISLKHYHNI